MINPFKSKKGLGRGLSSLIGDSEVTENKTLISISSIVRNKYQPRKKFEKESLEELTSSIRERGIIQPIIVRKSEEQDDKFEIVAGERRWRAAKIANLSTIPAIFTDIMEKETLEVSIVENLQRSDLNPIEESKAYENLMIKYNLTQEEVAERVGKDRSTIANYIRLLKLPELVRKRVANGEHTMGHARALLSLINTEQIMEFSEKAIKEKLSVRQLESEIKKFASNDSQRKKGVAEENKLSKSKNNVFIEDAIEKIRSKLGTKVGIKGSDQKGLLVIEYYSKETLEGIMHKILN